MRVYANGIVIIALFAIAVLLSFTQSLTSPTLGQAPLPLTALVTVTPVGGEFGAPPTIGLVTVTPIIQGESTPLGQGLVTVTPIGGAPDELATQFFDIAETYFPMPTSYAPGCASALPLVRGSGVTIRSGITIRYSPSTTAPYLTTPLTDVEAIIVDGPVCSNDHVWWGVQSETFTGWMAERNVNITFFRDTTLPQSPVCASPLQIPIGESVNTTANVYIRREPHPEGYALTVASFGTPVRVLSEAHCQDGYNWRQVQVTVGGFTYEGWMAEGQLDRQPAFFLDAVDETAPCYPSLGFHLGEKVRVFYGPSGQPKALRDAPNYQSEILYTLVSGVPLEITGDSVCIDAMNWWPVKVLSSSPVHGWIAEGGRPIPSIRPFDEPTIPYIYLGQ